jgi:hypothetical protein
MKPETREYYDRLKMLIKDAIGVDMTISVSETSFGTSLYIQDGKYKMRFSDHGISNTNRMATEELYDVKDIIENSEFIKNQIKIFFGEEYTKLYLYVSNRRFDMGW